MVFENDPEGYRIACAYAGHDFDKARTITIEPLYEYSGKWTIDEFQQTISNAVATIPADCLPSAKVELEGYDSSKLCISYVCPESDEVVADRVRRCEIYVQERRASERSTYESLKKKFEC